MLSFLNGICKPSLLFLIVAQHCIVWLWHNLAIFKNSLLASLRRWVSATLMNKRVVEKWKGKRSGAVCALWRDAELETQTWWRIGLHYCLKPWSWTTRVVTKSHVWVPALPQLGSVLISMQQKAMWMPVAWAIAWSHAELVPPLPGKLAWWQGCRSSGRLINSASTQVQIQDFELVNPPQHPPHLWATRTREGVSPVEP